MATPWYRLDADAHSLILTLHVQPNARRTEVAGLHGDALKIKVAGAAVDGQANTRLIAFLAQAFDVPLRQVVLKQGEHARRKVVAILHPAAAPETLLAESRQA